VDREQLEEQAHMSEQLQSELYEAREQTRQLRERLEKQIREIEEGDSERRQLMQQLVESQSQLTEKNRDIELHLIKIESLENIVKRREQLNNDHSSQLVAALEHKLNQLDQDRQKLISDNISLIR
jgi:hypothetical protein